ncbi:hypothetical protein DXA95_12325 [Odoribacter sp. OF09-27XD]|jgi:hypothetical protein|nr:hypothetical protein [Odoribacter sp. OF09-27XD]RHV92584.1 hypothetical protein DXA95_12325 [Odoribacter sp. OF09-27XD]DAV89675.1 MAG TPA: hypothetical protein [Bacteriophage sp.]
MNQPELEIQAEYLKLCNHEKSILELGGGKKPIKIGWQHIYTMDRVTKYTLEVELQEPKTAIEKFIYARKKHALAAKAASCIILNNFFKIKFFHWFFWRWLLYVRQYNDFQFAMIIIEGQKKSPVEAFLTGMQFLMMGKTTLMTMTKKEAGQFPAGQVVV